MKASDEPLVAFNDFPSSYPVHEATWDQGKTWWAWDPFDKVVLGPSWGDPEEGRWVWFAEALHLARQGNLLLVRCPKCGGSGPGAWDWNAPDSRRCACGYRLEVT